MNFALGQRNIGVTKVRGVKKHLLNPMHRFIAFSLFMLNVFCSLSSAKNGNEPLNHFGLAALTDETIAGRITTRFKAHGKPIFMIQDLNVGLSQGDIMRFQDKAVLIDADVWQTLQDENALQHLNPAPLLRVQAKASGVAWENRAKMVSSPREKKAYLLGSELIKILEDNFGGAPAREQMVMTFDGPNLVLMAPVEFYDQLRYTPVKRIPSSGTPNFISLPPQGAFVDQDFYWQAWAIDPTEPAGNLRYTITGELPKGLVWDASSHSLRGKPSVEGRFKLVVEVRNKGNANDTQGIIIAIQNNHAPYLAQSPKALAVVGQKWFYHADAVDRDHAGETIKILTQPLPPGMEYDSIARIFTWIPADTLSGKEFPFALRLMDPLNAHTDQRFTLKVIPAKDLAYTKDIHINIPWDTLQEGHSYTWEAGTSAAAWSEQGISLVQVTGDDSTDYTEGTVHLKPMQSGQMKLQFHFEVLGQPLLQALTIPVKRNLSPYFASTLGVGEFLTDQTAMYRPVAVDPENDPITLNVRLPENSPLFWNGVDLELYTKKPGLYAAEFSAIDNQGHGARQAIVYRVNARERKTAWALENRLQAGLSTWTLSADFGTGRLGLFTPDLSHVVSWSNWKNQEWPYIFFGGNLLGSEAEKKGNRLWMDLGFTLRVPNGKIATGGLYGRFLGEWTFPGKLLTKVESELQGFVHQGLLLVDSSGVHLTFGSGILEFGDKYGPLIDQILRDATAPKNAVFFTRIEGWCWLGSGFWAGPGLWREDFPMARRFDERVGGGLRFQGKADKALASNSFRVGWGPAGAGWSMYWSARISLNSPF